MIKKLLLSFVLLFSMFVNAQVGLIESFNAGVPAGWTVNGANFFGTPTQSCDGQSIRANVWTANGGTTITSPNFIDGSNATDLNFSFDYKLVDWSAATNPTAAGWGTMLVEYSTDGGVTWINLDTIDDDNHVVSATCANKTYTIDAADLPDGSDFQFRIDVDWSAGDYYFYLDNVVALQTSSDAPNCDSILTLPTDGATDVEIETNLVWTAATGLANEYFLTVGTSPGLNDVVDNVSTGIQTSYAFDEVLAYATTYYVTILPSNANGLADSATCQEFSFTTEDDPSVVVDCQVGPLNETYCYVNNDDSTFVFTSNDGTPLNFTINSGNIELFWDDLIVLDSDGTVLFDLNTDIDGFGNYDLAGTTFQSSGDSISFQIQSDGSVSCETTDTYFEIDYTVACATCVNPSVDFELVTDCLNAPQFFIDVDITDLGSATSLQVTDSEGITTQTVTETGVVQVGPFPNGTDVTVDVLNVDDANCLITSELFGQEFCTLTEIECIEPFEGTFCYGNNEDTTLEFISEDGSALDLDFNAGAIQNVDNIIVFDTDGTVLFDGNGDLTGLSFQSTGDSISFQITSGGFNSCQTGQQPQLEYAVACATCINPDVSFELVSDCLNGPQFFIDVDITDLGSATSLEVSDSEGVTTQTVTETGIVQVGPFSNGTDVTVEVLNLDDANCLITSDVFGQEFCAVTQIDCSEPFSGTYCYGNNEDTTLEFVSEDGTPLNFTFDAGAVEVGFDDIIVFDTDGSVLFDGDGELAGLTFQSSGDTISFQIDSDGSVSCASGQRPEIEYTVTCATCINQDVTFQVVDDCPSGQDQFFIDVNITDLGSALTLDLTDNQGNEILGITETGVQQFGPFPNGTNVQVTVANVDDSNCIIVSNNLSQVACPPDNNSCDTADVATVNPENLCVELNSATLFQAGGTSVPSSCHPTISQDVWFEFEAISTVHTIAVIPEQSGFFGPPIGSAVYADDCGSLTELFCSTEFDNFGNSNSMVAEGLTPGETYFVRVYNFGTTPVTQVNGGFDLCITTPQFFEENELCADLEPFCAPTDDEGNPVPLVFPNGYFYLEENVAEEGPDYGCLGSEPNPAWFYITVDQTGALEFEITQSTAFDANGQVIGDLLDVDFIAYGPFSEPVDNCDNLSPIVDCSFSASSIEQMVFPNAVAGEVYIVLITNFNQSPGYISLVQTNFGDSGGGTTDCSDVFGVVNGCASEGVILSSEVEDGTAYQWFILDDPESDPTNPANYVPVENGESFQYTAFESGNYYLLSQSADGSFLNEFFTVRLSEEPELAIDLNYNLCEGDTLSLDATPTNSDDYSNISYQWFDQNGIVDGAVNSEYTITETGLYEVHITTEELLGSTFFECTTIFQINVEGAEFEVNLGENQSFCAETEPQTITAEVLGEVEPDSNISYLWSTGEETVSIQVTESGVYSVTVTVDGCSKTEEVVYVFNEVPFIDIPLEILSCEYPTETFDATPVNSDSYNTVNYQWINEDGEIVGANTSEFAFPEPGLYSVEITTEETQLGVTFECSTIVDFIVLGADFEIDLGNPQVFCDEAESKTITASLSGILGDNPQISYLWSNGSTTESIQVTETGVYEVEVTVNACVETASISYTFNESPVINLPTEILSCDLSSVVLDATPENVEAVNTTFEWSFNGELLADEFMELISADDYGFGVYQLVAYSNDQECSFIQEVVVAPRFVSVGLTLDSFENLFCPDQEVVISADVTGLDTDIATFTWFVNGVEQPTQSGSEYTHVVGSDAANPNQDVIAVSVNVGGDCVADTVEVELERYELDNCIIPEGMSPDGINNTLDLRFLAQRSGIRSLEIFNRYGRSVFKQNNYTNEFIGQNQNGSKLLTGTYFYVIKFNQEDPVYGREHQGWIYINREQ